MAELNVQSVELTSPTNGGFQTTPRCGNEDEPPTNQSGNDELSNSKDNEQSLSRLNAEQTTPELNSQLHNNLRSVRIERRDNELIVTGLGESAGTNQCNRTLDEEIILGSEEDIANAIEQEQARMVEEEAKIQQEANRLEGLRILKLQRDERIQREQENERIRQQIEDLTRQINRAKEQEVLEMSRRMHEPTGAELQKLAEAQRQIDTLNATQREDLNMMNAEQLRRHCQTLERQTEFHKQQAKDREAADLDKRRWRSKLVVPKVGKGLGALNYPEWVLTLTNLEKANGIPIRESTQFWKEGLDNEAAGEAHECKTATEVKEVARRLYWTEADKRRSEIEFAGFRRIRGETILQTKKRYIATIIGIGDRVDELKKTQRFAEAFMDVTAIASP
jgi:hypothetical protein